MDGDHEIMRLRALVKFATASLESLSEMLAVAETMRANPLSALITPIREVADSSASLLIKELRTEATTCQLLKARLSIDIVHLNPTQGPEGRGIGDS